MSPSLPPTHTPTPLSKNHCEEKRPLLSLTDLERPKTPVKAATNPA